MAARLPAVKEGTEGSGHRQMLRVSLLRALTTPAAMCCPSKILKTSHCPTFHLTGSVTEQAAEKLSFKYINFPHP